MPSLPWIVAFVAMALLAGAALIAAAWARRPPQPTPLPIDWGLSARPVFSGDERRIYRLLREALPHHVILSKLPLVRFCQPDDLGEVGYWYDLLGSHHVTFAICSANGRVLAAVDLDTERAQSKRVQQIKQSVLGACRIRYLRCPVDNPPSVAELQLLVPAAPLRSPQPPASPMQDLDLARDTLATTVASRRAQRSALWQDSTLFHDSFFAPDSRQDVVGSSEFGSLPAVLRSRAAAGEARFEVREAEPHSADQEDIGGVVVDPPPEAGHSGR